VSDNNFSDFASKVDNDKNSDIVSICTEFGIEEAAKRQADRCLDIISVTVNPHGMITESEMALGDTCNDTEYKNASLVEMNKDHPGESTLQHLDDVYTILVDNDNDCRSCRSDNFSITSNYRLRDVPHPKRDLILDVGHERRELMNEASGIVDCEYESLLATFVVRCPFIYTMEKELRWNFATQLGFDDWSRYCISANVAKPTSLDVAAILHSNESVFIIRGNDKIEFLTDLGNGIVAPELLDIVCQQSILVREQYCSSLYLVTDAIYKSNRRKVTTTNNHGCKELNSRELEQNSLSSFSTKEEDRTIVVCRSDVINTLFKFVYTISRRMLSFVIRFVWFMFVWVPSTVAQKVLSFLWGMTWIFLVRVPTLLFLHTAAIGLSIIIAASLRLYFSDQAMQQEISNLMMQNQLGIQ
jgi:hypothetical protein